MSLIFGFGLTLCFLINNTMPYLPLVASVKISKSLSVIGFVFLSTSAHGSNFERQTVLFFSCLGFFVSISFNIADACNLCCFFDGTCHFCGLTYKSDCYQVLLLARYTIQGPNMFTTTTDPKNKYKKFSFKFLEP